MGLMDIFKKKKKPAGGVPEAPAMPGSMDADAMQGPKLDAPPMPSDSEFMRDMKQSDPSPIPEMPSLDKGAGQVQLQDIMGDGMHPADMTGNDMQPGMAGKSMQPIKDDMEPYQLPKFSSAPGQPKAQNQPGAQPDFGDFDFSDSGQLDELEIEPDSSNEDPRQVGKMAEAAHDDKELPPIEPIKMDGLENRNDDFKIPSAPDMPEHPAAAQKKAGEQGGEEDALPSDQYTTPGDLMESYNFEDEVPKSAPAKAVEIEPPHPSHEESPEPEKYEESPEPQKYEESPEPQKYEKPPRHDIYGEHMIRKRIINDSMFVNVEVFKDVAEFVNALENDSRVAEETLFRIKDIIHNREKVYDKWRNDLEQVERELIQLDKILFNV